MRVSNLGAKNNLINNIQKNYSKLSRLEKQMGTAQRTLAPSDNPIDAITAIYSKVRINALAQYDKNAVNGEQQIQVAYDQLGSVSKVLQRIRELTVQAANGTYEGADRLNIATEVEELLAEVVALANSTFEDNYLFSGSKARVKPFKVFKYQENALGKPVIGEVAYYGDRLSLTHEIGRETAVEVTKSGSEVFWATPHVIVSVTDSTNYLAERDSKIRIDGRTVTLQRGDNLETVIEKINQQVPSVSSFKRELPDGSQVISIEANYPHKISLEDLEGGTALRELGLLKTGAQGDVPYANLKEGVIESGGSIFEALIGLRSALINNDTKELGSRVLREISLGLENLLRNRAALSATATRLKEVQQSLALEKVALQERLSESQDLDLTKAAIDFNALNYAHRISLQTAAKYIRPTLLDFL